MWQNPRVDHVLNVCQSNRLEVLADALAETLARPVAGTLAPEHVAVPAPALGRWLSLALATRLGVCANLRVQLPAELVWSLMRHLVPALPETSPFQPGVLVWRLLAEVQGRSGLPPALADYLADGDGLKAWSLCRRLAQVFDGYLVYRPDWVRAWEAGEQDHWQAVLWRRLAGKSPDLHWVALQDRLERVLEDGATPGRGWPARVSLFAPASLSPGFLDVIGRLADLTEVHLFIANPCREYWGDIVSPREKARRAGDEDPDGLYLETGNPLLASMGRQARDLVDMLQERGARERDLFHAPGTDTVLHVLQSDVLALVERGGAETAPLAIDDGDESVQLHVCHSPMREVEVLHDRLLAMFDARPGLEPADVLVLMPDMDAYAPYVDAVFGSAPAHRRIPFTLTGGDPGGENATVAVLMSLLEIPESRLPASDLLALLECTAVARAFELGAGDLERIAGWIRGTGIRWGLDGGHRADLGLPATRDNTWAAGIDRLLLGYAMPGEHRHLHGGVLPWDGVEGADARAAGQLAALVEALGDLRTRLVAPRPLAAWATLLDRVLERFFLADGEELDALQWVRAAFGGLARDAQAAGFDGAVDLPVLRSALASALERGRPGQGAPAGTVNFAALAAGHVVPARVVCILGLSDGAFPRVERPPGFDLMARERRRGDRSRRDEDRHLFLEAILGARSSLYLSYVGRDQQDNAPLPPSVLLSELLDCVDAGFCPRAGRPASECLTVEHPLQPFSARYYREDDGLFSYADEYEDARPAGAGAGYHPFVAAPLADRPAPDAVTVDELVDFLSNPARHLLRGRLGLDLRDRALLPEDSEPQEPDKREARSLDARLFDLHLDGAGATKSARLLRAEGRLPHGAVGDAVLVEHQGVVARFAARLEPRLAAPVEPDLEVHLDLGGRRLTGRIRGLRPGGLLLYRLDELSVWQRIEAWVWHLALNAAAGPGTGRETVWVAKDDVLVLPPLDSARARLEELMTLLAQGEREPLPFFPRSAWAYADAASRGRGDPLKAARAIWAPGYKSRGECSDPYFSLAFRHLGDPLNAPFPRLAEAVFEPLIAHAQAAGE